ncbi:MAG: hypothetical protein R3F59_12460 [Myxococcota bacterium]
MTRLAWGAALALALTAQAAPGPDLARAIALPGAAQALRERRVGADEVALAVRAARDHGLPAGDAADLLGEGARGERLDNFGHFVQTQLDAGLRGQALAQAIHEEKARRGNRGAAPTARARRAGRPGRGPRPRPGQVEGQGRRRRQGQGQGAH